MGSMFDSPKPPVSKKPQNLSYSLSKPRELAYSPSTLPYSSYTSLQQELMDRQRQRDAELARLLKQKRLQSAKQAQLKQQRLILAKQNPQLNAASKKKEQEARIQSLNARLSKLSGGKHKKKKRHMRSKNKQVMMRSRVIIKS